MMHSQLEVSPSQHIPILANIQRRITMGEQRKAISPRSKTQNCCTKVYVQDEEVWDSDEYNSGGDNEYMWPEEKASEENDVFRPTFAEPQSGCPLSPKLQKQPPP
nr:uncharacterized protein LOC129154614 [Nothobranchius furzeri]